MLSKAKKQYNQMVLELSKNSLKQLQNDLMKATCSTCKKVFTSDPELKEHIDKEHPKKLLKQEENNHKNIVKLSQDDLKNGTFYHLQVIKGAPMQPMSCRICKKEFNYLHQFQDHYKSVHEQKNIPKNHEETISKVAFSIKHFSFTFKITQS